MPRYLAEAIGTFCLVFAGTGAIVVNEVSGGKVTGLGISLVFGLIVVAMIYAIGHISGAHMNPAVTLGFYSAGRHAAYEVAPYLAAQLLGAVAASFLLRLMFAGQTTSLGVTLPAGSTLQSFVLEGVMTFMLMFTIMGVATDDRAEGTMAGIAIGAMVALEAAFGGPISGASMNPARSFGPALVAFNFKSQWLYWIAPCVGSVLGAMAYKAIRCETTGQPVEENLMEQVRVLFVCIHNSARSQMAQALMSKIGGSRFIVESAGFEPGKLNPLAVEAMQEIGIDISKNQTNGVFDFFKQGRKYHYVITVCDESNSERCPLFPGLVRKRLHWSFKDPSGFPGSHEERLERTKEVRDQIQAKVEAFVSEVAANFERSC